MSPVTVAVAFVGLFVAWMQILKLEGLLQELRLRVGALERRGDVSIQPQPSPQPVRPVSVPAPRPAQAAVPVLPVLPVYREVDVSHAASAATDLHGALPPLEARIGARWLLYVGVVAILFGVAYFEKMAFENHWVGEVARTVQGGIFGMLMVYGGIRFTRGGYRLYGHVISGCGVAVLYVSAFAAFNLYALISRPVAFALMCATTMLAARLADRERSPGLALVAVSGGFATPFLLPGDVDAQLVLFTYDAILIAGTMFLARRHDWPALNIVSYAFTCATFITWADDFYIPAKYLATEVFLTLDCAMFLFILRRMRSRDASPSVAQIALMTAPVAYYVASIANLYDHSVPLLVFLIALGTAGVIASVRLGSTVRLLFWAAVAAPLMLWAFEHAAPRWLPAGFSAISAVYIVFLLGHFESTLRPDAAFAVADTILLHVNGLWAFGCAYLLLEPTHLAAAAPLAAALAGWHGLLAWALKTERRDHALHFAGVGFTLLMVAIARQFDGPWITVGWAAEGAAVVVFGLRERREWLRIGGAALFAVAVGRLTELQFAPPRIDQIVLLNRRTACAAFVIALTYMLAWSHRRRERHRRSIEVAAAVVTAQMLTLAMLTSEIVAYWDIHDLDVHSALARGLMLSLTWALYATALILVGIRRNYAPIRYVAIGVFAATIGKVFAVDLEELDRVYRISSLIGLGMMLLITSYLYQQFHVESPADDSQ